MKCTTVENNRKLNQASDTEFFRALEGALLLEMKERGHLNMIEYSRARENLRENQLRRIREGRGQN